MFVSHATIVEPRHNLLTNESVDKESTSCVFALDCRLPDIQPQNFTLHSMKTLHVHRAGTYPPFLRQKTVGKAPSFVAMSAVIVEGREFVCNMIPKVLHSNVTTRRVLLIQKIIRVQFTTPPCTPSKPTVLNRSR